MSLKSLGLLAPLALGGAWLSGALGGSAYSRVVDRSPAQVMEAIADLDVRKQPGSPGTDPSRSGGVPPLFRTERGPDEISFVVLSGDKVATRMTAHLEPLEGGKRTRVTASVARGDAPDDFVSPAFRSTGLTLALFSMALEGELNELVGPPRRSAAQCRELTEKLLTANAPSMAGDPQSLSQGVGNVAQMAIALHAAEAELRRQGCDTSGGADGTFSHVSNQMGRPPIGGVTFEPGKPMVDVSRTKR
jgi:hypothetical protein